MKRHSGMSRAGARTAAIALVAAFAACVNDGVGTVPCGNGFTCPPRTVCAPMGEMGMYRCDPDGCGDDRLELANGELCDDGNRVDGDGCSADCRFIESCGNGRQDPGELCDPTAPDTDKCSADCRSLLECGDGVVNPILGEVCDEGIDGIARATATCDADCSVPWCGDSEPNPYFINPATGRPEECDGGGNTETCDADCTLPVCGDGLRNAVAGEACDDGENELTGACLPGCTMKATCGDGHVWEGVEDCDGGKDGVPTDTMTCDKDCTSAVCGDGYTNSVASEDCDDGNSLDSDGCLSSASSSEPDTHCKPASCGDGVLHFGVELCDDGDEDNGDGCPDGAEGTCQPARCGDGFELEDVEGCDDGDEDNTDECPDGVGGTCEDARCGDGFIWSDGLPDNDPRKEQCDDVVDSADCNGPGAGPKACKESSCGDGYVNQAAREECERNGDCASDEICRFGAEDPRDNCQCGR